MKREPLLTRGVIVGLATALLAALVVFGVDLSPKETKAILALVGALSPVLVAIITRPKVTPDVDVVARRLPFGPRRVDVAGPASPLPDGLPVTVAPVDPPRR